VLAFAVHPVGQHLQCVADVAQLADVTPVHIVGRHVVMVVMRAADALEELVNLRVQREERIDCGLPLAEVIADAGAGKVPVCSVH
jgi:hypothetical protein